MVCIDHCEDIIKVLSCDLFLSFSSLCFFLFFSVSAPILVCQIIIFIMIYLAAVFARK